MNLVKRLGSNKVRRGKLSMGQLISTLVYFFMAIWLAYEASDFYNRGDLIKAIPILIGSLLAFLATFRFQIQNFVYKIKKYR